MLDSGPAASLRRVTNTDLVCRIAPSMESLGSLTLPTGYHHYGVVTSESKMRLDRILAVALFSLLWACASSGSTPPGEIAVEMGSTTYVGAAVIQEEVQDGNVSTWSFTAEGRTGCMRGGPFQMSTRHMDSEDLVIFLQGGGACWTDFCLAVTEAPPGVPNVDVLNPDLANNPVADWNVVYVPYCDGSMFTGDRDHDEDGDGEADRLHRGLANISAALDVAKAQFPTPKRILFSGSSGGGFGAMLNTPLVRHYYPDAALFVVTDGAVGVARGASDPGFVERLMNEFDADNLLPADCTHCIEDGHVTRLIDWYLARDPDVRFGVFSSWYDLIIGEVFLEISPADLRDAIASETGRTHEAFPDRYRRFIIDGRMHTTLLGNASGIVGTNLGAVELPPGIFSLLSEIEIGSLSDTQSDGLMFSDWLGAMLNQDLETWADTLEEPGPVPE